MSKRRICLIETCTTYATVGTKACATHAHPAALQAEIERLRVTRPEGAWRVLRYPDMARLFQVIAELDNRAQPMKGASTEVVARSRSHNVGDGVVILGREDEIAIPGYAVGSYSDSGLLGAALSKVKETADKIEGLADTRRSKPRDMRVRCGSRKCSNPNVRQPPDVRFCAYCGRAMRQIEEAS